VDYREIVVKKAYPKAKRVKAQSAMEYLMTYGWAILIIAVVLASLFSLGVFNSASLSGNSCIGGPGYVCKNPLLTTAGKITFSFGQNTGAALYNIQLACSAALTSDGLPNPIAAFNSISQTGAALPASNTGNTLTNGQILVVSSLPCYSSTGQALGSMQIGGSFSGYIWVNYTSKSGAASAATNPWRSAKSITLTTKAT
jgi:hypothetical protein